MITNTPKFRPLTPCGETRREFLWEAGGGFVATALTAMLGTDGFFPHQAVASVAPAPPLAPRAPHYPGKAKRVIFIFNYGGVSQVDTFDPKPELNKHTGETMPNIDTDPLFKSRSPGKLLGSTRSWNSRPRCRRSGARCGPRTWATPARSARPR